MGTPAVGFVEMWWGTGMATDRTSEAKPVVLVLDDEEYVRTTIEIMLRRSGYEPVTVSSGAGAVAAFEAKREGGCPVAVALLDLTLPGGETGESVLRRLESLEPSILAIATSGDIEHAVMSAPESAGFAASLAKPFRLADLTATLASVLSRRRPI
jgi:CheY-like chemotaxis protein